MKEARAFSVVNLVLATLFLISAAIQYNDPDPWRWIAIYTAAGVACLVVLLTRRGWIPAAAVGAASLTWIGAIAPRTLPNLVIRDLVRPMQDKTPAIEESRELLGLTIIAVWMVVLVLIGIRRERGRGAR